MITGRNNRLLVVAVRLVGAQILDQFQLLFLAVIISHVDFGCVYKVNAAGFLRDYADARVTGCLLFHAGSYDRSFRRNQRNALTLHVRSHQRTVRVIVLQERYQGCRNREYHSRRYVHVLEHRSGIRRCLIPVTAGYVVVNKISVLIQLRGSLCYMIVIFLIRCHVDNIISYSGSVRVVLVDLSVRSFDEAVLIDLRVCRQRVDQADVGAFRRLDRAHSSIVRIMYVTDFETCSVSGKTAGSQCRETSLMCNLGQRVVLVHELGQLGRSEELLERGADRLCVNQCSRVRVIYAGHLLADTTLHTGHSDAELILQQFSDASDPAVSEVINVVLVADAVLQMHVVVDRSKNIFLRNMLGNQKMHISAQHFRKLLRILVVLIFLEDFTKSRIINLLGDAKLFRIAVYKVSDVNHQVGQDLHAVSCIGSDPDIRNCRVLDFIGHLYGNSVSRAADNIAVCAVNNVFRKNMAGDSEPECQLLVEFIAAYLCKVIPARIKEHGFDQ